MTDIDPEFVQSFNRAAALGRGLEHEKAESAYAELVTKISNADAGVTLEFVATVRMRHAFCLMDLGRYEEARAELERAQKFGSHLDEDGRYEVLFALGNTLGNLGKLDAAFNMLVEAISLAEDMDDYTGRPAQCWASILRAGAKHEAWAFVEAKAAIALNTARLRGMGELEALAANLLRSARGRRALAAT